MAIEVAVEKTCLRLSNPELKLHPKERPKNCGDCYQYKPDIVRNPICPGYLGKVEIPSEDYYG